MSNNSLLSLLFACCAALSSCVSKKYIPVSQTHSESSALTVHDTIFRDRVLTKVTKETTIENVKQHDSTSIVVDSNGNIKRTDNWHRTIIERDTQTLSELRDSVSFYKSLCTYLLTQRKDSIEKPIIRAEKFSVFDRLKQYAASAAFIIIVCIIGYAIWRIHRRR